MTSAPAPTLAALRPLGAEPRTAEPAAVPPAPEAATARKAPDPATTLRITQVNMWNMFDTVDDPKLGDQLPTKAEYEARIKKFALTISGVLGAPDVLSLNEVENQRVLDDL